MVLYHGSSIHIKDGYLRPNKAFNIEDYTPKVYLTSSFQAAILYSLNPIKEYIEKKYHSIDSISAISAHFNCKTNPVVFYELYENMLEDLFHKKTYVYKSVVDESLLEKQDEMIFTSQKAIPILEMFEIPDLYQELLVLQQKGLLEIKRFNELKWIDKYHLDDAITGRAYYCSSEFERNFFREKFKWISGLQFR